MTTWCDSLTGKLLKTEFVDAFVATVVSPCPPQAPPYDEDGETIGMTTNADVR